MGMARSVTAAMTIGDAGAFLDFLAGRPEVTGTAVGTTGYCMGGRASLLVAGHHPDRVAAAASFHGGRLAAADDPDSPYLARRPDPRPPSTWPPPRTTPPARPSSWSGWRRR